MTNATVRVPTQRTPELLRLTVVVIGGSAGIGLGTARNARTEGADVILTARNPERLNEAADELAALSSAAFDASDPDSLARFRPPAKPGLPPQTRHGPGHHALPMLRR